MSDGELRALHDEFSNGRSSGEEDEVESLLEQLGRARSVGHNAGKGFVIQILFEQRRHQRARCLGDFGRLYYALNLFLIRASQKCSSLAIRIGSDGRVQYYKF